MFWHRYQAVKNIYWKGDDQTQTLGAGLLKMSQGKGEGNAQKGLTKVN